MHIPGKTGLFIRETEKLSGKCQIRQADGITSFALKRIFSFFSYFLIQANREAS